MKKLLTMLLCAVLALSGAVSLAACGGDDDKLTLSLNKTTLTLDVGASETLTATPSKEGETVTWSSSNPGVATVSSGKVTAVAEGSATITAKAGDATATCAVTVREVEVPVTNPWTLPNSVGAEFSDDYSVIYPYSSSFGTAVVLNKSLADKITGPYKFSFTLDATAFEAGEQAWISVLGSWNESMGNCLRTGIYFSKDNRSTVWDVCAYGPCQANSNLDFTNVVFSSQYPDAFPDTSAAAIDVDFVMGYDEDENIVAAVYLDDVLVWFLNYTEYYGAAFTFTDTEYVGFDFFNPVLYEFEISNVTLTNFEDPDYVIPDLISLEDQAKQEMDKLIANTLKAPNWSNVNPAVTATPADVSGKTEITLASAASTAFGQCVVWNPALAKLAKGGYEFSFQVDATNIGTAETWLGILPAWVDGANEARMAIHWNQGGVAGLTNFASYGNVNGAQDGFSTVVAPSDLVDFSLDYSSPFAVKVQLKADGGSIKGFLYIENTLVMTYDYGAKYAAGFSFDKIEAIGFDYLGAAEGIVLSDFAFRLL